MELQARDKRALIGGGVAVTLLLAYLMWPSGARESAVELVPAENREKGEDAPTKAAGNSQTSPAVLAAQAQPPVPQAPAQAASPIPDGLKLTGVVGGGAIFSFPDGSQRLIRRGRDVAPGVILQGVRLREVVLAVGPTSYRMGFGGPAVAIQPPTPAPAPTPASASAAVAATPTPATRPVPTAQTVPLPPRVDTNPPRPGGAPIVVMPTPLPQAVPNANLAR